MAEIVIDTSEKAELIKILEDEGIVKTRGEYEKSFILKSGRLSRFFIDIKEACTNPKVLKRFVNIINNNVTKGGLSDINFEIIAAVVLGGTPIVSVYSYITETPCIMVREQKHDSGTESEVIGDCYGNYVLLVDDVSTAGESIVNAVKAIRAVGGICHECVVVVDREEGAKELCEQNNIDLIPILRKGDFGIKE